VSLPAAAQALKNGCLPSSSAGGVDWRCYLGGLELYAKYSWPSNLLHTTLLLSVLELDEHLPRLVRNGRRIVLGILHDCT